MEHFPSSPMRPPKFTVRCDNTSNGRLLHMGFCTLEAAKGLLDLITKGKDLKWESGTEAYCGELRIRSPHLEDIVEASSYKLPSPYPNQVRGFLGEGGVPFDASTDVDQEPGEKREKAPRKPKAKRAARPSKDGAFGPAELADALKTSASDVRKRLRSSKLTKPEAGWSWPQAQFDEVLAALK